MSEVISIIYGVIALSGVMVSVIAGWKANNPPESFDWSKVIESIRSGGIAAPVLSAVALSATGGLLETFLSSVTAFTIGIGFNPAINYIRDASVSKVKKQEMLVEQKKVIEHQLPMET
jgi:hypothetical protein